MKIFVAIPVYDGKLQVQTADCLLKETAVAAGLGDELHVVFLANCSVPAQGRNELVQQFLESECERLFFLDADLTFPPGSLVKLCHMPHDFVGGCYRQKLKDETYPIHWKSQEHETERNGHKGLWADEYGMLEVAMLPTGFLSLSRSVFSRFREAHPGRDYTIAGHKEYAYFQTLFRDGVYYGEDVLFCKEWVEAGGTIHLDPEIPLSHWDAKPTPYPGHIGNWLKARAGMNSKGEEDHVEAVS